MERRRRLILAIFVAFLFALSSARGNVSILSIGYKNIILLVYFFV